MEDGVSNGSQYWNGYDGMGRVDGYSPETRLSVSWNDLLYEGPLMEFRYLKTLIPVYGFTGFKKPGRYRQLGRGVTLQFMKDGEWQDIEEVTEVKEW